jgi:hypothetical protein
MDTPYPKPHFKTVKLERIQLAVQKKIELEFVDSLVTIDDADKFGDYLGNSIVVQARVFVWGENAGDMASVTHPLNWWEAVKERWFPAWAKKRWPVLYKTHNLKAMAIYPKFRPSIPDYEHTMMYQASTCVHPEYTSTGAMFDK